MKRNTGHHQSPRGLMVATKARHFPKRIGDTSAGLLSQRLKAAGRWCMRDQHCVLGL